VAKDGRKGTASLVFEGIVNGMKQIGTDSQTTINGGLSMEIRRHSIFPSFIITLFIKITQHSTIKSGTHPHLLFFHSNRRNHGIKS